MPRFPIVACGAALGALVVTVLLRDDPAETPSGPISIAADLAPSSAPGDSLGPDLLDRTAAPEALASIADPVERREAALALLDAYGHNAAAIERLAASLPPAEAVNFRIAAIVRLGASDLDAAFAATMSLPNLEQRRLTLRRLAPMLAETDPLAAIAAVEGIGSPGLETEFVAALLDAWAVHDPQRVFDYLESADMSRILVPDATFAALAARDPERLLAMAGELRRDVAGVATEAALEVLIERDAVSALEHIAAMPLGSERTGVELAAAQRYGELNPEAAWAWAMDAQIDALSRIRVVRGIHQVDPDRAWEIMRGQLTSPDARLRGDAREQVMNYVYAVANSGSREDIVTGFDRLLSLNDPHIDAEMQTNLQAWAGRDPEGALDWSLQHLDRVDADRLLTSLSAGLAQTDMELARQTVPRLDQEYRTAWASGVGRSLAESDLPTARAWAYELPQGPLRDAALHEFIRGEAQGGTVDSQVFGQFSSDRMRSEAASSAARRFACDGRKDEALEIARTYITDERLLRNTVGEIDGSLGAAVSNPFRCSGGL